MTFKIGSQDISDIYLGSEAISKVYLGANEIYSVTLPPSSGPYTQADMPSQSAAWTLAPQPAITASTTSAITGTLVLPTDNRISHVGVSSLVAAATSGYYRPDYLADVAGAGTTSNPRMVPQYGVRFTTNASQVEIKMIQRPDLAGVGTGFGSSRMNIRLKINGQWTSLRPTYLGLTGDCGYDDITNPEFISPGTEFWVRLNFGSAATRTIEYFTISEYGGVKVPSGSSLTAASALQRSAIFIGDSLNGAERHGMGNYSLNGQPGEAYHKATYTHVSSMVSYLCQSLGYDNVINASAGSTGFRVDGDIVRYSNANRLSQAIAHNPDLVIIGTSFNDIVDGVSASTVQTNAETALSTLRAGLPNAIIVIFGNPNAPIMGGSVSSIVAPYNNALLTVAVNNNAWFINPSTGNLYNPSGNVVWTAGDMMAGNSQYLSDDNTHPTQAGSEFFGKLLAEYVRRCHPVS